MSIRSSRAVSPVVAVILMVAITVILSAVIGTFVLNIGQSTTNDQSSDIGIKTDYSDGTVTATVITGTSDKVKLLVNGSTVDTLTNASAGETLSGLAEPSDRITVVSVNDDSSTVILGGVTLNSDGTGIPTDGLVSHWSFDTGSGSTALDSTGSHNGTIIGASWTSDAAVGQYALSFNESEHVEITGWKGVTGTQPRTWSLWVKPSGSNQWLVSYGNRSSGEKYEIRVHNNNNSRVENHGGRKFGGPNLTDGQWHHIAIVFPENGTDVQHHRIYVDGQYVSNTGGSSQALDTNPVKDVWLGDSHWYSGLVGKMDDVYVYNRSLSQSEIQQLYERGP